MELFLTIPHRLPDICLFRLQSIQLTQLKLSINIIFLDSPNPEAYLALLFLLQLG